VDSAEQPDPKRGLRVYVDPHRCIGNAKCTTAAPGIFVMDEETRIAVIENEDQATVEQFFAAARVCPTQAIIIEQYGRRVFPRILTPMFGDLKPDGEEDAAEEGQ
jgi:ferredoxin